MNDETKHEKFERLARARLDAIRDKFRLLRNLTAPTYEYTTEDVNWIRNELNTYFDDVLSCFDKPVKGGDIK